MDNHFNEPIIFSDTIFDHCDGMNNFELRTRAMVDLL